MTTINEGPLFRTKHCQADDKLPTRLVINHVNPKLAKGERMKLVVEVDPLLNESRQLTSEELKTLRITEMGKDPVYLEALMEKETIEVPFAKYFSPEETLKDLGLGEKLGEIQKILANNNFREFLRSVQHSSHESKRGTVYDGGVMAEQGNQVNGLGLCRAALNNNPNNLDHQFDLQHLNVMFAELSDTLVRAGFGNETANSVDRFWAANAAVTPGSPSNHYWSHGQFNYTKIEDKAKNSLGKKGHVHVDQHDVPTLFSFVFFLSTFPEDYFPGRFTIMDAGLMCSASPFGVLLFSGRHPHCGSGNGWYRDDMVNNSPLRYRRPANVNYPDSLDLSEYSSMRINAILYPNHQAMAPTCVTSKYLKPEMLNADNLDVLLRVFGTRANWYQWRMRFHIKEDMTEQERSEVDPHEVVSKFGWVEDGVQHFPDLEVAKMALEWSGKTDTDSIKLHKLYIASNCGDRLPKDPNAPIDPRLARERVRKSAKKNGGLRVQCTHIGKTGRCKNTYWISPGSETGCRYHPMDSGRAISEEKDEAENGMELEGMEDDELMDETADMESMG